MSGIRGILLLRPRHQRLSLALMRRSTPSARRSDWLKNSSELRSFKNRGPRAATHLASCSQYIYIYIYTYVCMYVLSMFFTCSSCVLLPLECLDFRKKQCSSAVFADELHDPGFAQSCSLKRVTFTSLKSSLIFGNWLQLDSQQPCESSGFLKSKDKSRGGLLYMLTCLPLFTCVGNTWKHIEQTKPVQFGWATPGLSWRSLGRWSRWSRWTDPWAPRATPGSYRKARKGVERCEKMCRLNISQHDSKDDSKLGKSSAAFSFHSALERCRHSPTFPSRCTRPSLCPTHASRKRSRGEGHNWRGCHEAPSKIFNLQNRESSFHQLQRFARRIQCV